MYTIHKIQGRRNCIILKNFKQFIDMPVYESAPVVFEIGYAYTKVGFASEAYPRAIISSEVHDIDTGIKTNIFSYNKQQNFYDQIVEFIEKLFFKYALVSPKERKIVIVENILCPTEIREILAKVLFRHFEVLSIFFVPTHLVVLATLAVDTALVIDIGYKEAIVIPVYIGVQVLRAWQAQPLASEAVHNEIKRQLIDSGINSNLLTDEVLEDIKVRLCFVTTFERSKQYKNNTLPNPCPDVNYPVNGKEIIKISGRLRETVFEVLFPDDNDRLGLPYIILDSIMKCPLDMRRQLAENILLIGGTTMIMGLHSRLKSELLALLESDNIYRNALFFNVVKFHTAPSKPNFTAWLGGSIYGGTKLIRTQSLTKETYAKYSHVPDWINFQDNRSSQYEQL